MVLQKIIRDKLNISKLKLQHTLTIFNILAQSGKVTAVRKDILYNWIESKGYYCNYLNKSYSNSNYHKKDKVSISEEVLITNYPENWRNK